MTNQIIYCEKSCGLVRTNLPEMCVGGLHRVPSGELDVHTANSARR